MPEIIGWAYDADLHCHRCRPDDLEFDSEGNPVHPIFSTDEVDNPICGDCGEELEP